MKSVSYLKSLLCATLLLASSCQDDADARYGSQQVQGSPASFVFTTESLLGETPSDEGSVLTRATQDGSFDNGNAVGIYAYDKDNNPVAVNLRYVYDSSTKSFKAGQDVDPIWIYPNTQLSYYAYYPYKEGSSTVHSYTLPADQSSNITQADVLHASATAVPAGKAQVAMTFRHVLSFVSVNYGASKGSRNYSNSQLLTKSTGGQLNVLTGMWTPNTTAGSIKPMATGNSLLAVIAPQSYSAGESLGAISFTDGSTRQVLMEKNMAFQAGYRHSVNLGEPVITPDTWTTVSLALSQQNPSAVFDAIGSNTIQLVSKATQKRIVRTYHGDEVVKEVEETQVIPVSPSYVTSEPDHLTVTPQGVGIIHENMTESERTFKVTATYEGKSVELDMKQLANVFTKAADVVTLYSLELNNASMDACGHINATGTATMKHVTGATTTLSGAVAIASKTTYPTKTVTPSINPGEENTDAAARQALITASYTEGGITKSAHTNVTQPGATYTETTTWDNSVASFSASRTQVTASATSVTLTAVAPTSTTRKTTSCETEVSVTPGKANITYESNQAWATVSGSTIQISQNTGVTRKVTITARFSNGTSKYVEITQSAATVPVDGGSVTIGGWGTGEGGDSTQKKSQNN